MSCRILREVGDVCGKRLLARIYNLRCQSSHFGLEFTVTGRGRALGTMGKRDSRKRVVTRPECLPDTGDGSLALMCCR